MSEDLSSPKLAPSLGTIRRLLPFAGSSLSYLPLASLLLTVMATVQVLLPQVMRLVIDGPLAGHSLVTLPARWEELRFLASLFIGFLSLGFCANYLSTWLLQKFGQNLVLNLRHQLFAKLHRLPISYFDKHAVGRTVSRVVNDSNSLSELFTSVLAAGLGDLILVSGILGVLLFTDPVLSVILAVFCPVLGALVMWFRHRSAPLYKVQRALVARMNAYFSEIMEGLSTVKSFQAHHFQKDRFGGLNQDSLDNELQLLTLVARFRPGFAVARIAASAALLTVGGWSIIEGSTTIGTLISSLLYINLLFSPLEQLAERYNILIRATVASERVIAILDLEEERTSGLPLDPSKTSIRFENVSFHYAPDKPVLHDVSFAIERGESVALVGPTGSGKSTIISLLLGFYRLDPGGGHRGRIEIGGQSFSELDLEQWRRQLAFVSQDLFLFKGTVAHNVMMHKPWSEDTVRWALSRSACLDFVEQLPEKAQTIIGEKGQSLSTGQRQLLSFARALAFDPQFLILDEATASIDSETESKVEEALDALLEGRQAIIVAHRLSTVRRADKILVLENGRVAESGSHQALMELDGLYAQMVRNSSKAKADEI